MSNLVGKQSRPQGPSVTGPVAADHAVGKRTLVEQSDAPVQPRADAVATDPQTVQTAAARGTATASTALPHGDAIQRAFGRHDISGIQAHTGGDAAASARDMGADAYATGNHVVLGKGSDLFTVAHEAAHVVQQRGGVQLKGGVGQVGDVYERHADEVATAVVQGNSAETLLDRFAGGASSGATGGAVQRRMGCEAEIAMPVTNAAGAKMAGDFKLINHEYFTLVTDSRTANDVKYSNLEFVMKPFDQLAGTIEQANAQLDLRLNAMKALYDQIHALTASTPVTGLPGYGGALTNPHDAEKEPDEHALAAGARIDPTHTAYSTSPDSRLAVHYTVGFPINKLHDAAGLVARDGFNRGSARPKTHAIGAQDATARAVEKLGGKLNAEDLEQLKGAIALLYTQVAAFAESSGRQRSAAHKTKYERGQIKNKAALLSRVDLAEIYDELPAAVQRTLRRNETAVLDAIADALEAKSNLDYNEDDIRQPPGQEATTLAAYTSSAIGGEPVSQQQVFGGMNLTGIDREGEGGAKVPVEMRQMYGQFRTWDEFVADAKKLVADSRQLIEAEPPQYADPGEASGRKRARA